jgi:ribosomal protein S30
MPKQTTNKATKRLQNRKKYETIVEEVRLQLTQVM